MPVDIQSKEGQIIRRLIPLSTIPTKQFESICNKISIETAEINTFLFKKNDANDDLFYLIQGTVRLQSDNLIIESIRSETDSAKFALAHQIPRKIDAYTESKVHFIKLDPKTLEIPENISHDQEEISYMAIDEPNIEEDEEDSDDDWMTTLLKSPIFRGLSPANLQQIIISLEEINYKKGEFIIKQGDQGDYYYLIKKGLCLVSRKPSTNAKEIKLAQLRAQETFGEDSLLSGEPRNVSVSALTDTVLIRLSKDRFITLIKEPSLKFVQYNDIKDTLSKDTLLVDVRSPDEYNKHHLPNSSNTPFFSLRMFIKSLDKKKSVIVICENGKTSEAAAFLLLRNKISAQIIEGGIGNIPADEFKMLPPSSTPPSAETTSSLEKKETQPESTSEIVQPLADSQESLLTENNQLKHAYQKLKAEKEELERKYRILYKQTEKLKSVLDTFKND